MRTSSLRCAAHCPNVQIATIRLRHPGLATVSRPTSSLDTQPYEYRMRLANWRSVWVNARAAAVDGYQPSSGEGAGTTEAGTQSGYPSSPLGSGATTQASTAASSGSVDIQLIAVLFNELRQIRQSNDRFRQELKEEMKEGMNELKQAHNLETMRLEKGMQRLEKGLESGREREEHDMEKVQKTLQAVGTKGNVHLAFLLLICVLLVLALMMLFMMA